MKRKIALLCCGWSSYYVKDFISGMTKATKDQNVDIYCFNAYQYTEFSGFPNSTGFSVYNLINYEDFDGVIILSDLIGNVRILEKERLRILKAQKPALTINRKFKDLPCIRDDNYSGAYKLMEHLIKEHGVTDFAFISGKEKSFDISERYRAFRTALKDNQIEINTELIFTIEATDYDYAYDFFSSYIRDTVREGKKLPQAVVCANDLIASAVQKVAWENNIQIPEALKIVGYDDLDYIRTVKPALTTVSSSTEQIGFEAVEKLLSGKGTFEDYQVGSNPVIRETCGCEFQPDNQHNLQAIEIIDGYNQAEAFSRHLGNIEEVFTEAPDVFTLLTNLEAYFGKAHRFEGRDFCIFLKSDWSSVLINSEESLPQNLSFGTQVQSIVSIQENKKYPREMISTKQLMSPKMKTDGSNFYIIMPIYNHSYVHGYFVSKNSLSMFDNRRGYLWTRSFGTNIERFRKKNMYKQMSQQFLKLSTQDALSGMMNRVGLEKLAKPFYEQNKKNGLTTVLFFVDINRMKVINDKFGHLHGDLAVKTISAAVLEVMPKSFLCIRYGGDEFLVIGNSKNYNGEDYCKLIKERIEKKTSVLQLPYDLSASVGTYSVPSDSTLTLEEAVKKVDEIMYIQKEKYHKTH